jgi:hypothetical protein
MAPCCCSVGGVPCPRLEAVTRVTKDEMEAATMSSSLNNWKREDQLSYDLKRSRVVCDHHVFDVIKAPLKDLYLDATGNDFMDRRDFIRAVLMVTGTHKSSPSNVEETPAKRPRVSIAPGSVVTDVLSDTFKAARPYITNFCFVYAFMLTLLRAVLICNNVSGYGRHVWDGSKEGTDVLRFFAVLYTISSQATLDALRGGAIAEDVETFVDGKYDLRLVNLPCVPTYGQLKRYMGSPWRIQDVLSISSTVLSAALGVFPPRPPPHSARHLLAVTFDAVYGESRAEIVKDLDGRFVVVGGGTVDGLVGAALSAAGLSGDFFGKDEIATKLCTVVLQSFHSKHDILVAILPINEETGVLISTIFFLLRRILFDLGSWLIFAGGDGAKCNLEAWKLVKAKSAGDATTLLGNVEEPDELPFFFSGDDKEHNTKGLKRDADGDELLVDGEVLRFDRVLLDVRGHFPVPGSSNVHLTPAGDHSRSRVAGKLLVEILGAERAVTFHEELCKILTKPVVDPKDTMATDPARRCGMLGALLREVGLDRAAKLCDLIKAAHDFSRGVNADGEPVTPSENLSKIKAFNRDLAAMRDACLELEQASRGAKRLRGFISEDLFELFKMSEVALEGVLALCEANGLTKDLRSTLPYSATNETWHGFLRRVSPNVLICSVARAAGQVLEASLIITDLARSWIWPVGCGTESEYNSSLEQSPEKREAALLEYHATGKRAHVLQSREVRRKKHGYKMSKHDAPALRALRLFKDSSNTRLHTVKLRFRGAVAHRDGDASKYGQPMSVRRSLLSRSMESPHLLKKANATGRSLTFQVSEMTLVDGPHAWRLTCGLGVETVVCRQNPKHGVLELDVLSTSEIYAVPFESIYAVVMDLAANARPQDSDGVVTITFAIVNEGRLQVLSVTLLKKDVNTCRMLVNLVGLQEAILESALVEGGTPSERAKLLLAIQRDGVPITDEPSLTLVAPWVSVEPEDALDSMPGLARLASVGAAAPPPLADLLRAITAKAGSLTLKPRRRGGRSRGSAPKNKKKKKKKKKHDDDDEDDDDCALRRVNACIEARDEDAMFSKRGKGALMEKWDDLRVYSAADGDGVEVKGFIYDFEWRSDLSEPQWLAVIEVDDVAEEEDEVFCVLSLPKMVIAAESDQPDCVLLDYAEEDDEFDEPGDEELAELARIESLEEDDDDNDDDDDDDDVAAPFG